MSEPTNVTSSEALALARIEVKLDNALEAQKETKSTVDNHSLELITLGTRVTKLETRDEAETATNQKTYTGKQLAATGTAAAAGVGGLITAILRGTGKA